MTQLLENPIEQRIVHGGHTWEQFKLIQQGFEGFPGVRLFYYNGTVEILMPGRDHEVFASFIGYLVMTFLLTKGIRFKPTRSMTQEKAGVVSVQADESYCIGEASINDSRAIPDLSIEVVFSSGGEGKLARYQALEVKEVWFWEDGVFSLYHLREGGYQRVDRSQLPGLQELNIDLLNRCVMLAETDEGKAVAEFRRAIEER
ncbi:MAG: Uma2 family endonuclease [Drouetiella hepatica Uher 2000/2452]|jgi:Uma2 family endonuclease|uniref:Uma2 family endonuclease n=1 Tax=Drouetiella hepatica Uher 2000/2452 TaxID=904376 RepID=A0A951QGF5_9CYAN|nr:Uma2 family endonuclease [Drouetiella hepatica Uher 2000/2452]